jgi:tripartite-type tricarboxylate transporter receptor subunit TctC
MLKKSVLALGTVLGLVLSSGTALAAYPEQEAKIVVPFKPGGATDIIYRVTSGGAEKTFGKSIVPVNMDGAGGVKGARFVKGAPADGYTLLAGHDFLLTTYHGKLADFTYTAFEPVCLLTQTPNILVTRNGLPFKDWKGLIDYARANPGKLSVTYSPSSTGTLFFDQIFRLAGLDKSLFRVITINGTGPQIRAILGGHADIAMGNVPSALSYAREGKLSMIAVSSEKRLDACPDLPTFKELGVNFTYATNRGVFAPKGTDKSVVDKIAASYKASLDDADVRKKIYDLGSVPVYMGPQDYAKFLAGQDAMYSESFKK